MDEGDVEWQQGLDGASGMVGGSRSGNKCTETGVQSEEDRDGGGRENRGEVRYRTSSKSNKKWVKVPLEMAVVTEHPPYCVKSSSISYISSSMYHAPDHLLSNVCISLYRALRTPAAFPVHKFFVVSYGS